MGLVVGGGWWLCDHLAEEVEPMQVRVAAALPRGGAIHQDADLHAQSVKLEFGLLSASYITREITNNLFN